MTDIKLISPATVDPHSGKAKKPETIVIAEFDNITVSISTIHHRARESETLCTKCGAYAMIWTDSEARWEKHPRNCLRGTE